MPRVARELTALEVKKLSHSGGRSNSTFAVGGVSGLILQITPKGGRTWLLRTTVGNRRREIGLGGYPDVSLAQAREKAREAKDAIRNGVDPVEERKAAKSAIVREQQRGLTFADAVEHYLEAKMDAFSNAKHRAQWRSTLENYAIPILGKMRVADIEVQDILQVLEPIWKSKTETASRLRGRIEAVLSWATVAGHRKGENPARWGGNLKELLPAPAKIAKVTNHPAIRLEDAPHWFAKLRSRDGLGSRALEFLTLTAARSQEVRGAVWGEFDLHEGIWVVPAGRMKMDREHRVPLSSHAQALLHELPRFADNPLVFPAPRGGELSDMSLSSTMRRLHKEALAENGTGFVDRTSKRPAVPHGLRSTFRDWAAEQTDYPGDLAETALAHKVSNAVEAAYRRGDMIEKRRKMMEDWGGFLIEQQ